MRWVSPVLGLLLLAGCSSGGGTIDSTESVCNDFAAFVKDGAPAEQRPDIVDSIGQVIGNADEGVQQAYKALTNTADGAGDPGVADDTFAQSCFDAGWDG